MKIVDFKINQEEIIEEFCENIDEPELNCDGNCYLVKELQKVDNVQIPENTNSKGKSSVEDRNSDWFAEVSTYKSSFVKTKNRKVFIKDFFAINELLLEDIYSPPWS